MDELYDRYQRARDRSAATRQDGINRRQSKEAAENKARQEAAIRAQEIAAQARRDKQLNLYDQGNMAQRANIGAIAAAMDDRYTTQRDQRQLKGTLKRDAIQDKATTQRDRQQALDQQQRDERLFGYSTAENEQQFGQQLQRDYLQQGYSTESDKLQHRNTLQRDAMQFGFDTQRQGQQQLDTLERDAMQSGVQAERDQRLNQFDTQRDERQQQFTSQTLYQREAADVSAKWMEDVQRAKANGLDFSAKQQQEMKELDESFRKNVLNSELDEGLKQQAILLHQKKLAAIIPNETVSKPDDEIGQTFKYHPEMKSWLKRGRDSQGNTDWEAIGGSGSPEQAFAQKQVQEIKQANFDRIKSWKAVLQKHQDRTKPDATPFYADDAASLEAAKNEFAQEESIWLQQFPELEPLFPSTPPAPWSGMGDSLRRRNGEDQPQEPQALVNPYRPQEPPQTISTTTNIDEKLKKTADSGDQEANAALEVIKRITSTTGGRPEPGTPEFAYIMDAYRILDQKGISIDDLKKPKRSTVERLVDPNIRRPAY